MTDLDRLFRAGFGAVRAADLLDAGLTRRDVRRLHDSSTVARLRHGWYADPWTVDPQVREAVAAGGVLTCVSALAKRGIWTPPHHAVHLRRSEHHTSAPARNVHSDWVHRHWVDEPATRSVDSIGVALRAALRCVDPEHLVAILDSVLQQTTHTRESLADLLADGPQSTRALLDRCDGRAESGTESLVRFRLTARNVRVRSQVAIAGVGRVDFLIGRRLVIEVDSRAHHTSDAAYRRDRRRDRKLVRLGYLVIRITYEEVMYDWADVEDDVMAIVRRGDHLRKPGHRGRPRGRHSNTRQIHGRSA